MTKDEFEAGYAKRSGITVEELHELGLHGYPCDCGEETCQGWQMLSDEGKKDYESARDYLQRLRNGGK